MFFSFREKCCYMLIFANECAVLIESFEKRFEATPFFAVLCRWRCTRFAVFVVANHRAGLNTAAAPHYPTF